MNLNDLNCPQFVNFDSSEFLSSELSSMSLDAPDWCDSAKKSKEITLMEKRKIKHEKKFESPIKNKELSDEKENQKSKTDVKCDEPIKSFGGVKRKHSGLNIGEEKKKPLQHQTNYKRANFNPLKQLEPYIPAQSPQLPLIKRRCLPSALEHKSTSKKLDVKMPKPNAQYDSKATVPKIQDTLLKTVENFQFRARPVPACILKGPKCLKTKEVKTDIKAQNPKSNKPPDKVTKGAELQPFRFDRLTKRQTDKEKIQRKEENMKEVQNEKKMYVFSAHSKPKVVPSSRPCVSSKLLSKPEPFRFGLDKFQKTASKECTAFKARPATVLKNKPFIPKPSPKLGIEVREFKLHTQQRAAERRLKQLAEKDKFEKDRVTLLEKLKLDRAEILKKRRDIFERYHIKIKPLENKL